MEEVMKPLSRSFGVHKQSHAVSKLKPKIRVVHILAPQIIKTDVENFRELVQRLTGKPSARQCTNKKKKKKKARGCSSQVMDSDILESGHGRRNIGCDERVKEEEEEEEGVWRGGNSGFGGFGDLDGFIQDMTEFPLPPSSMASSQTDAFG